MSPNPANYSMQLAVEIKQNNKIVICKLLFTTIRVFLFYVLGNVLYSVALYQRDFKGRKNNDNLFYWLSANFLMIEHAAEIFNLYWFDKVYRRIFIETFFLNLEIFHWKNKFNNIGIYMIEQQK